MTDLITLEGDYGYEAFKISGISSTEIDASEAHWIVANIGDELNRYPFSVRDSSDIIMTGGTIDGEVPLDLDWEDAYVNSAAVYSRNVDDVVIQDWTISQAWDAIRVRGDDGDEFTIDHVWLTDVRDDAVENDDGLNGTISNSLFDGVFVGLSLGDSGTTDQTDNLVTLDNVLIRMKSFEYKGELTHQSIFKVIDNISPALSIHDCVSAIEDVDHAGQGRLEIAWDSVVSSSNNYFLNLSDDPLPDDYLMPPDGFTVLQGQEARDFWESARDDWLAEFEDGALDEVEDPVDPDTPADDETQQPTDSQDPASEGTGSPVETTGTTDETGTDQPVGDPPPEEPTGSGGDTGNGTGSSTSGGDWLKRKWLITLVTRLFARCRLCENLNWSKRSRASPR